MLLNSLGAVALLASIALAFATASLAMARTAVMRGAQMQLHAGYQRAALELQQTIANGMQTGAAALPSFTPLPAVCSGPAGSCAYRTSESIALTIASTPQPAASCDPSMQSCALNAEQNVYASESRISARISVVVASADGSPLAARTSDVVVRTFASPPYAAIASASQSDDGGLQSGTIDACAPPSPGTSSDTSVRVAYRNLENQSCSGGSVWAQTGYGISPGAPTGWSQ